VNPYRNILNNAGNHNKATIRQWVKNKHTYFARASMGFIARSRNLCCLKASEAAMTLIGLFGSGNQIPYVADSSRLIFPLGFLPE